MGMGMRAIRSEIFWTAVYSRICLWILQVVVGILPDHEASKEDVYLEEKRVPGHHPTVQFLFGGFGNWDSEYFLMISDHGYIYEQTLAFFPFLPAAIRTVSSGVTAVVGKSHNFPIRSLHLMIGWMLNNLIAFPLTVVLLYELTYKLHGSMKVAKLAALLFIVNPANIFMCSLYTESMFSAFTFGGMLAFEYGRSWVGVVMFMLGGATRSNGVLAVIYVVMYCYRKLVSTGVNKAMIYLITLCLVQCVCVVLPFIIFQLYGYSLYCPMDEPNLKNKMAAFLITFLPTLPKSLLSSAPPEWCSSVLPFSYGHIQAKYWNVGFLRYYQLKQIPNFLLATPIVILSGVTLVKFLTSCWPYLGHLYNLFTKPMDVRVTRLCSLLPYCLHLAVMLSVGVLSMHVQVLTRFIAASCPVVYWLPAGWMAPLLSEGCSDSDGRKDHTSSENITLFTMFNTVLRMPSKGTRGSYRLLLCRIVLLYFVSYNVLGFILHCNFYPWT